MCLFLSYSHFVILCHVNLTTTIIATAQQNLRNWRNSTHCGFFFSIRRMRGWIGERGGVAKRKRGKLNGKVRKSVLYDGLNAFWLGSIGNFQAMECSSNQLNLMFLKATSKSFNWTCYTFWVYKQSFSGEVKVGISRLTLHVLEFVLYIVSAFYLWTTLW